MANISDTVSAALDELAVARRNVRAVRDRQVRSRDERQFLQATALAWFHSHRPAVLDNSDPTLLADVDAAYHIILSGTERNLLRATYLEAMQTARDALVKLRASLVVLTTKAEAAPDFAPLTSDSEMRAILERRWIECTKCVSVKAHLAAIVMMGGLLEALFVARAKQTTNKAPLFASASVPKNPKTGDPVPLGEWMLKTYLLVGHDVGWITKAARDLAAVLGEFRNYIHPEKEHKHGVKLSEEDSAILWGVTKNLVSQLIASVAKS